MSAGAGLYLLRHGETAWNRDGNRYAGRTDLPLADRGREQAQAAARALAAIPFTRIISSTLQRSRETAAVIAAGHGIGVTADARLVEIDFGAWEGKTRTEIERDDPETWAAWLADPSLTRAGGSGESGQDVLDRVTPAIDEILAAGETSLIVGHNTLNRLYIAASLGMPLRNYRLIAQSNAGINLLERDGDTVLWRRINHSATGDI